MDFLEAKDLFGIDRFLSTKQEGGAISERAGLVKYFSESLERPPKFVGVRMAHYTLDQMYAIRSQYEDRLKRNDAATAAKWWWWTTRTTKAT